MCSPFSIFKCGLVKLMWRLGIFSGNYQLAVLWRE